MSTPLRGDETSPKFTRALGTLAGQGVAMLVAGAVDESAMQAVVRRLFGEPTADRYRVLALLNGIDPGRYLPPQVTPDRADVRVLQSPRGRSAATSAPAGTSGPSRSGDGDLLGDLHGTVTSAAGELAQLRSDRDGGEEGGFEPGELRVVVDSLQPLVEEAGLADVIEWLRTDPVPAIRDPPFRGRSHWLYFGDVAEPAVQALMADPGLFDVLLEVRRHRADVQYRWVLWPDRYPHLEDELQSPWMTPER